MEHGLSKESLDWLTQYLEETEAKQPTQQAGQQSLTLTNAEANEVQAAKRTSTGSRRIPIDIPTNITTTPYRLRLFSFYFFLKRIYACGTIKDFSKNIQHIADLAEISTSTAYNYRRMLIDHNLAKKTGDNKQHLTLISRHICTGEKLNKQYHILPLEKFKSLKILQLALYELSNIEEGFSMHIARKSKEVNTLILADDVTIKFSGNKLEVEESQMAKSNRWGVSRVTAGRLQRKVSGNSINSSYLLNKIRLYQRRPVEEWGEYKDLTRLAYSINHDTGEMRGKHVFVGRDGNLYHKRANIMTMCVSYIPFHIRKEVWAKKPKEENQEIC